MQFCNSMQPPSQSTAFPSPTPICTVLTILSKSRKSTSDFRCTSEYFNSFKLVQQLKERNGASFKEFLEQLSYECVSDGSIIQDSGEEDKKCWLVASGEVKIVGSNEEVVLKEGEMFGCPGCGSWEQWGSYVAVAKGQGVLFWIPNSKFQKFLNSDNLSEEIFKRNFIGEALNIEKQGSFYKNFVRKFSLKVHQKSTMLFREDEKLDVFMIIRKGTVELFKTMENRKVKIGILGQGSFINETQFFLNSDTICECSALTLTPVELYTIPYSELLKSLPQLPNLQAHLQSISSQRHYRRQYTSPSLFLRPSAASPIPPFQPITPLFRKSISGLRSPKPGTDHPFIGPAKYQQMVQNQQKVWVPLSQSKNKYHHQLRTRIKVEEVNKMLKEEKMNRIMVRQLVNKRVKGIADEEIQIQLKTGLFKERVSGQFDTTMFAKLKNSNSMHEWHNRTHSHFKQEQSYYDLSMLESTIQQKQNKKETKKKQALNDTYSPLGSTDTGLINELSKNLLDYKKNVLCLKSRPSRKERLPGSCDLSQLVKEKMKGKKYYQYVNAPREKFQCELNQAGDAIVFRQSKSGKMVKRRIRLT